MTSSPRLVILAAGASQRLGEPKALARIGDRTALEHLVGAWPGATGALVVTGKHGPEIAAALPPGAEVLEHLGWENGRTGGVAAAVAACPGKDFLLAPADCPLVPTDVFSALLERWEALGAPALGFLSPYVDAGSGRRRFGHPFVVGRALLGHLLEWPADRPLRELRDRANPLEALRVQDSSILDDLDTPQDLDILRRRVADRPSETPGS